MRSSYWSSDVCSSDLIQHVEGGLGRVAREVGRGIDRPGKRLAQGDRGVRDRRGRFAARRRLLRTGGLDPQDGGDREQAAGESPRFAPPAAFTRPAYAPVPPRAFHPNISHDTKSANPAPARTPPPPPTTPPPPPAHPHR